MANSARGRIGAGGCETSVAVEDDCVSTLFFPLLFGIFEAFDTEAPASVSANTTNVLACEGVRSHAADEKIAPELFIMPPAMGTTAPVNVAGTGGAASTTTSGSRRGADSSGGKVDVEVIGDTDGDECAQVEDNADNAVLCNDDDDDRCGTIDVYQVCGLTLDAIMPI